MRIGWCFASGRTFTMDILDSATSYSTLLVPNGTGAMPELHILCIPLQLGWYSTLNCKAATPNGITMTKTRIIVYA